ncbi:hypothetical protein V8C43DRAFT_176549 [Trichoderma afarasin]
MFFYFSIFTSSCLFYPIVRYTAAYAATGAPCLLLFLPCFSSFLSGIRGELGIPGPCLLKTNLFTRERGRNMIVHISDDTGDTAYAVTLRFAFYTLERNAERLCFPVRRRHKERHRPALVRQRAAWTDGVWIDCASERLATSMQCIHPLPWRGEARRGGMHQDAAAHCLVTISII